VQDINAILRLTKPQQGIGLARLGNVWE